MTPLRPPNEDRGPVFLERKTYRARRMMDGARLLPVLGVVLFMVPALWPKSAATVIHTPDSFAAPVTTSGAMLYVFGLWGLLTLAAALMARGLARAEEAEAASAPTNSNDAPHSTATAPDADHAEQQGAAARHEGG